MKKTYIIPQALKYSIGNTSCLLAGSEGVLGSGEYDIDYGGVDTGGEKEPSAKFSLWDDDEELDLWEE